MAWTGALATKMGMSKGGGRSGKRFGARKSVRRR